MTMRSKDHPLLPPHLAFAPDRILIDDTHGTIVMRSAAESAEALSEAEPGDAELIRLRSRVLAEIEALHTEIERLTEVKEQTRADLRRLLEDCLARLDDEGAVHVHTAREEPPLRLSASVAEKELEGPHPFSRLLQGIAGVLCNPAKRRLAFAGGWDQAPMLFVLALIILQQLVPTIQRMALLG